MLITITYGKEVFDQSAAKFHAFGHKCLTRQVQSNLEDQVAGRTDKGICFMWQAAKDDPTGFKVRRHGGHQRTSAAPGLRDEFGAWTTQQYEVEQGCIIRLFGSKKMGNHQPALIACMFLEAHEHAPYLKVYARLTGDHRAQGPEVLAFEGRAYHITLRQAAAMQVVLDRYQGSAYEDYNQEALFRIQEIAPATNTRPQISTNVVTNSDGNRVNVTRASRRRAIQV